MSYPPHSLLPWVCPHVLVFALSITHRLQTFFSVSVTGAQRGRWTGLRGEVLLPKDMADFN